MWEAKPFGQDCLGNSTGYVVERYKDGQREVAGEFVTSLYTDSKFEITAKEKAEALACLLNGLELLDKQTPVG